MPIPSLLPIQKSEKSPRSEDRSEIQIVFQRTIDLSTFVLKLAAQPGASAYGSYFDTLYQDSVVVHIELSRDFHLLTQCIVWPLRCRRVCNSLWSPDLSRQIRHSSLTTLAGECLRLMGRGVAGSWHLRFILLRGRIARVESPGRDLDRPAAPSRDGRMPEGKRVYQHRARTRTSSRNAQKFFTAIPPRTCRVLSFGCKNLAIRKARCMASKSSRLAKKLLGHP